ncbi:hypothetical protein ES703_121684 [subsurface metagenome]
MEDGYSFSLYKPVKAKPMPPGCSDLAQARKTLGLMYNGGLFCHNDRAHLPFANPSNPGKAFAGSAPTSSLNRQQHRVALTVMPSESGPFC